MVYKENLYSLCFTITLIVVNNLRNIDNFTNLIMLLRITIIVVHMCLCVCVCLCVCALARLTCTLQRNSRSGDNSVVEPAAQFPLCQAGDEEDMALCLHTINHIGGLPGLPAHATFRNPPAPASMALILGSSLVVRATHRRNAWNFLHLSKQRNRLFPSNGR